jgi:transcriptional regulator with XRE-family HTH domain
LQVNTSKKKPVKTFGQRILELRRAKNLGQRPLAVQVGVSFTYVSRIENENLDFGPYPSDALICKLAQALDPDEDELLLLARTIPDQIKRRVLERPEAFRTLAALDDKTLDLVLAEAESLVRKGDGRWKASPRESGSTPT